MMCSELMYLYMYIHMSICVLFGERISWKKFTLIFHKQINEAGRYKEHARQCIHILN